MKSAAIRLAGEILVDWAQEQMIIRMNARSPLPHAPNGERGELVFFKPKLRDVRREREN